MLQGRVVRVAMRVAAVPGLLRCLGQRCPDAQTLHQIRVGDEGPTEGDQIRQVLAPSLERQLARIAVVGHVEAPEHPPQPLEAEARYLLPRPLGRALDAM